MAYQQGIESLGNGVTTKTVTFPAAYTSTPELIIPVIENTVDGSPLLIDVVVTAKSNSGFTVKLGTATNSVNYKLVWVAGSTSLIYQIVTTLGVRISSLTQQSGRPTGNSYIPFVSLEGVPTTKRLTWSLLSSFFGTLIGEPPSSPTDPGVYGNWAFDEDFFYSHDGTRWGRTPRITSNWDLAAPAELVQEGTAELVAGERSFSVTFETAFGGSPPHITFSFENTDIGNKQILVGLITARSVNGFTVVLNTTPDTDGYNMHWRATGFPQS